MSKWPIGETGNEHHRQEPDEGGEDEIEYNKYHDEDWGKSPSERLRDALRDIARNEPYDVK